MTLKSLDSLKPVPQRYPCYNPTAFASGLFAAAADKLLSKGLNYSDKNERTLIYFTHLFHFSNSLYWLTHVVKGPGAPVQWQSIKTLTSGFWFRSWFWTVIETFHQGLTEPMGIRSITLRGATFIFRASLRRDQKTTKIAFARGLKGPQSRCPVQMMHATSIQPFHSLDFQLSLVGRFKRGGTVSGSTKPAHLSKVLQNLK